MLDFIKIKNICFSKAIITKNGEATNRENICNTSSDEGLVSGVHKELLQLNQMGKIFD